MDTIEAVWAEVDRLVADAELTNLVAWVQGLGVQDTLRWFDEWWDADQTTDKQRRVMLLVIYGGTQIPDRHIETQKWVARFRRVGFVSDGPTAQPPAVDLAVFRGAPRGREVGMSWTTSEKTANGFAKRFTDYGPEPGLVWQAIAERDSVLALIYQRDEYEVVVDPIGLRSLGSLTSIVPST